MASGYGSFNDILNMTIGQFRGALKAEHRADIQKTKDLMFAFRAAQADKNGYKQTLKALDKLG